MTGKSMTKTAKTLFITVGCLLMASGMMTKTVAGSFQGSEIRVKVNGIERVQGTIKAALDSRAVDFDSATNTPFREKVVPVEAKTVSFEFSEIPPGTYAIRLFHDENDDGKLNTNLFGVPTEPYGISQNARARFGLPGFDEASFPVKEAPVTLDINVSRHSLFF